MHFPPKLCPANAGQQPTTQKRLTQTLQKLQKSDSCFLLENTISLFFAQQYQNFLVFQRWSSNLRLVTEKDHTASPRMRGMGQYATNTNTSPSMCDGADMAGAPHRVRLGIGIYAADIVAQGVCLGPGAESAGPIKHLSLEGKTMGPMRRCGKADGGTRIICCVCRNRTA